MQIEECDLTLEHFKVVDALDIQVLHGDRPANSPQWIHYNSPQEPSNQWWQLAGDLKKFLTSFTVESFTQVERATKAMFSQPTSPVFTKDNFHGLSFNELKIPFQMNALKVVLDKFWQENYAMNSSAIPRDVLKHVVQPILKDAVNSEEPPAEIELEPANKQHKYY